MMGLLARRPQIAARLLAVLLLAAAAETNEEIAAARNQPRALFIVVTTQRTGSTWLSEELDTHPCLEVGKELFLDVKFFKHQPEFHWREPSVRYALDAYARPTGSNAPEPKNLTKAFDLFYRRCVRPAYLKGPKGRRDRMPEGCGFKWMLSQYFDEYWGRWLADFVKTRGARLVFLTRTNVLRKYVSQAAKAVSEKTRVDAYYANETWYGGFNATTAAKDRLELKTGAALLRDLAKIDRDYEIIARLQADAEHRGVPWFHATYEELQANKSKALGDIVDFVVPDSACPHAFAEAKVEKMHPEPMSTYVKNWDAVAATLRESKYARFMDG